MFQYFSPGEVISLSRSKMESRRLFLSNLMNQLFYLKYWLCWISRGRADWTSPLLDPRFIWVQKSIEISKYIICKFKNKGSVGWGKSFHSTTYLPTPPIIVIRVSPIPIICILYLLCCVTSPPLSGLLSCGVSQSPSRVLNFSHLSLSGHSVFSLLPWVRWLKWFLVIWRMECACGGGG